MGGFIETLVDLLQWRRTLRPLDALEFLANPNAVRLSAFTHLTDDAAKELTKACRVLDLSQVGELSNTSAQYLSETSGDLCLGLRTLSPTIASALANHNGCLWLNNVESMSDEVAALLALHQGDLGLGLKRLSEPSARALINLRGDLWLGKLADLSDEAARVLSRFHGRLRDVQDGCAYSGIWPERLSPTAAKILMDHPSFFLSYGWGTNHGSDQITVDQASRLIVYPGDMYLGAVTTITFDVAVMLGKCRGYLDLSGLTELSLEVATELSKHVGELLLYGLKEVSDDVAIALATHEGELDFSADLRISEIGAMNLAKQRERHVETT